MGRGCLTQNRFDISGFLCRKLTLIGIFFPQFNIIRKEYDVFNLSHKLHSLKATIWLFPNH